MSSSSTPSPQFSLRFALRVLLKAGLLFIVFNLVFAWLNPLPALGRLSAYNRLFPGRERLPYGDDPALAYNLSLFQLDAMFASHELAGLPKAEDEFRVLLIGDSATWGYLLRSDQTLSAYLNAAGYTLPDGRRLRAYNLGYPVMSLTKDLVILSYALEYQPDLIVWPLTLESLPRDKQLFSPLLQNNPQVVRNLIESQDLELDLQDSNLVDTAFLERTIAGQRRTLADMLRLQLYGIMLSATGIDQAIPESYTPRMEDLPDSTIFHELEGPELPAASLSFDVLAAGVRLAGNTPMLIVNEPIFISQGENSDLRYNFFYPRWAYDAYRIQLSEACAENGWRCMDLWDAIPAQEFTNTAVHMSPQGTAQMAEILGQAISTGSRQP